MKFPICGVPALVEHGTAFIHSRNTTVEFYSSLTTLIHWRIFCEVSSLKVIKNPVLILIPDKDKGKGKPKVKVRPRAGHEGPKGEKYHSTFSLTSALGGGGWSTPRSGRFTPWKDPVTIVQEAGWAPGPVWTGAENLAPTGIRYPNPSSPSLYRLSHPGP